MSESPPRIFLDLTGETPLLCIADCDVISSDPPEELGAPANEPDTYESALIEVREMKTLLWQEQTEGVFLNFKLWKTLVELERKWMSELW